MEKRPQQPRQKDRYNDAPRHEHATHALSPSLLSLVRLLQLAVPGNYPHACVCARTCVFVSLSAYGCALLTPCVFEYVHLSDTLAEMHTDIFTSTHVRENT